MINHFCMNFWKTLLQDVNLTIIYKKKDNQKEIKRVIICDANTLIVNQFQLTSIL